MTETVSNVFDVACPNALKLQEISSLAIVEDLWRTRIGSYLRNRKNLTPSTIFNLTSGIVLEKVFPKMPREIYDLLYRYVSCRSGDSIVSWLCKHSFNVFRTCAPDGWYEILRMFHDFALDWNGTVHEVRTAKRMLLCDRIGIDEKFRIACWYCLEDDIKRIWPSVCTRIDLKESDFEYFPQLYYWTCFLRNELHKIPNVYTYTIDELLLFQCKSKKNFSSALYFWNRLPVERKSLSNILWLIESYPELFLRFILPKLNETQLGELFDHGVEWLITDPLTERDGTNRDLTLPVWIHLKDKIDNGNFIAVIKELLQAEASHFGDEKRQKYQSVDVSVCCEIWNSAAQSLKQSFFDDVLLEDDDFLSPHDLTLPRRTRFLITILLDGSFEQRSALWNKYWPSLIVATSVEDLLKIMKLCFGNEEEIALFRENTLFEYENIVKYISSMCLGVSGMRRNFSSIITEINRFLSFCNPDALKRLEVKQLYLGDPRNFFRYLRLPQIEKLENEFLNDAV